ncbi:MAG: hypothetical protein LBG96_15845 [Tannerella sp.]|nr:hypothetical protein [Tannerella sp.]
MEKRGRGRPRKSKFGETRVFEIDEKTFLVEVDLTCLSGRQNVTGADAGIIRRPPTRLTDVDMKAIFRKVRTVKIDGKPYAVCIDLFRALGYKSVHGAVKRYCKGAAKCRVRIRKKLRMTSVIPVEDARRLVVEFAKTDDQDDWDDATSIVPVEYTKEEKKYLKKRMVAERNLTHYFLNDKNLIF